MMGLRSFGSEWVESDRLGLLYLFLNLYENFSENTAEYTQSKQFLCEIFRKLKPTVFPHRAL